MSYRYGPRGVWQWTSPNGEDGDHSVTIEIVGAADEDEWGTGHVFVTVRNDEDGREQRIDLDVTNAEAVRDAVDAAAQWVRENAGAWS